MAATAQASTGMVERVALREALRQQAHASGNGVVKLPLPEPPRVSAAAARSGLARLASSPGPERLLVGVRSHGDVDGVAASLRALGADPQRFDTIAVLAARVPSAAEAIAALRDDPRVAYVERDEPLRVAVEPFDTIDPFTGMKYTWAYDAVRAGEALAAVGGGSARTVSVIDTGLDVTHPEFAGQVQQVFDTEALDTNVTDIVGHGTFVTGLIAARDGNTIGGKGVAGTTKVLAVRASRDREGRFSLADLINGIEFSIRRGADVINMSLAGTGFTRSHARALEAAFFNDVLPVAASGNNAENGNPLEFPAAAVGGRRGGRGIGLSVAATKPDGNVASFSNHNPYVSLAAPGASQTDCRYGVFSTIPSSTDPPWDAGGCPKTFTDPSGSRFAYGEGTSFAAPIVSGLAALAWQAERRLASEQVADVLVRAANGGGWNEFTGAGVVDGMHAVEIARAVSTTPPSASPRRRRSPASPACSRTPA
jgi:subtilisin family serine protease